MPPVVLLFASLLNAQGAEAKKLRLGYFPNITHAQALYARAGGAFEKAIGITIEWVPFNAGPTAIEAIFADAVDATFVGPSPTINGYLKSKGSKFVIIAGSARGGSGLVVREDAGIHIDRDFGGKTIATPQLGNTQDVAARVWFAQKGYKLRERGGNVALVPLSNPDQLTMFRKKQIDGAWTVEPWLSRLEVEGGGRLFLDEKSLWPDGKYVTTHLIVSRVFLEDNQETVRRLLESLVDVTQVINSNKTAAAAVLNEQIRQETGKSLKPEVILKAMGRLDFTWDPACASLKQSAENSRRIGFIRSDPQLKGIYNLSLLNAVLEAKKLPQMEEPGY
jgi:NitT/TauT family transport system substrate-binding protein